MMFGAPGLLLKLSPWFSLEAKAEKSLAFLPLSSPPDEFLRLDICSKRPVSSKSLSYSRNSRIFFSSRLNGQSWEWPVSI
jgi:hypothetical protein